MHIRLVLVVIFTLGAFSHELRCAGAPGKPAYDRSVVYVARNFDAIHDYQARPQAVERMVNRLVMAVAGKADIGEAWRTMVTPQDIVGIKVSTDGGPLFSTHPAIISAIARGLGKAGVPSEHIVVWDRDAEGLVRAGYRLRDGYTMRPVPLVTGYDPEAQVSSPMLGKLIWGDLEFRNKVPDDIAGTSESEQLSSVSYLNKVLSQEVTKVVNVPTMSTTRTVALAGCLYNMTVRNMDNWRRFCTSREFGDPFLAELYYDERIGGKVVLNVMDGLIAQYAGGPSFEPNYAFHHASIYAGKDPVAVDAVAVRRIDRWRAAVRLPLLEGRADFLKTAELYGLGKFDPAAIELRLIP
jgi:uncharacterized protein (DUF362 family)